MTGNSLSEDDFEAIHAAVLETARGRWFLAEFARRQRATETDGLTAAIKSLEASIVARRQTTEPEHLHHELEKMTSVIAQTRRDVLTAFGVQSTKDKTKTARSELSRADAAQRAALSLNDLENRLKDLTGAKLDTVDAAPIEIEEITLPVTAAAPAEPGSPAVIEATDEPEARTPESPLASIETPGANLVQAVSQAETLDQDLFEAESKPDAAQPAIETAARAQADNHEALATTLRAAIARVRGPSSDIDALSFEAKSVLFA